MAAAVGRTCDGCGDRVEGVDVDAFLDAYVAHVAAAHADWGYTDRAVRSYARKWFVDDADD